MTAQRNQVLRHLFEKRVTGSEYVRGVAWQAELAFGGPGRGRAWLGSRHDQRNARVANQRRGQTMEVGSCQRIRQIDVSQRPHGGHLHKRRVIAAGLRVAAGQPACDSAWS